MKLALLLFGMSKCEYIHWSNEKKLFIDFEKSYENYKEFIFDFFKKKGYDIDVYFATNILDNNDKIKLCKTYKPINYTFVKNGKNKTISRNKKLQSVINLCLKSQKNYDLVLITRFDLLFKKDFDKSNIKLDKFNLVSILQKSYQICDNFYLFPYKYLKNFSYVVTKNIDKSHHYIQKDIENFLGGPNINFILNEHCYIAKLTFYEIVRNYSLITN
jgi:hypothetical protein